MTRKKLMRGVYVLAAAAAVGVGSVAASSATGSSSAATTGTTTTAQGAAYGRPPGHGPMLGAPVTGAAATKAKAAALARYPGTVERVLKAPGGGYEVHVIKSDKSEGHVLVNDAFQVTGVDTRGPGPGGPGGHMLGAPVTGAAATKAKTAALARYPGTVE